MTGRPQQLDSEAVVALCTSCPYDDCISPDRGCPELRKLRTAEAAGEEYHPPENWGTKEPDPQALLDAAWEKLPKKSKAAKPTPPAMMVEELPQPTIAHIKLHRYNVAIKALEDIHGDAVSIGPTIVEAITALKSDRAARFDHLIDWDAIARGGKK